MPNSLETEEMPLRMIPNKINISRDTKKHNKWFLIIF